MARNDNRIVLETAIEGFLIARNSDGLSKSTLTSYRQHLTLLCEFLHNPYVHQITLEKLRDFINYMRDEYVPKRKSASTERLSHHTLANIVCSIKAFFSWYSKEFDAKRPDTELKFPAYVIPEVVPFNENEIKALIKAAEWSIEATTTNRKPFRMKRPTAKRDVAIILTLLDTGMRSGELAHLKIGDLNLDDGSILIRSRGSGKKSRSRIVYLGKAARRAIWRYLTTREDYDVDDPLFVTTENRRMCNDSIRLMLYRIAKAADVPNVYPHRFRHTFAIEYLRNGGDIFTLQKILGHSTLDMVNHYLHIVKADLETAHRRASPADRWKL